MFLFGEIGLDDKIINIRFWYLNINIKSIYGFVKCQFKTPSKWFKIKNKYRFCQLVWVLRVSKIQQPADWPGSIDYSTTK